MLTQMRMGKISLKAYLFTLELSMMIIMDVIVKVRLHHSLAVRGYFGFIKLECSLTFTLFKG
jgi:hypothetical protein